MYAETEGKNDILFTLLTNSLPLSCKTDFVAPYQQKSFSKHCATSRADFSLNGKASTHFVKKSVAVNKYLNPNFVSFHGPIRSMPIISHGSETCT